MQIFLLTLMVILIGVAPGTARADCTSPNSPEGGVDYFPGDPGIRFCDGNDWIPVGGSGGSGGGGSGPIDTSFCDDGEAMVFDSDTAGMRCTNACDGALEGLMHRWKLDEDSGSTAIDVVGGNSGTITNATLDQQGKIGSAYNFNGTDSRVTVANVSFSTASNYTISFWYKGTETYDGGTSLGSPIISTNNNAYCSALALEAGKVKFDHYTGGQFQDNIMSTTLINDDEWHHVVFVHYDDVTADLYVDGVREVTGESAAVSGGGCATQFLIQQFMHGRVNNYTSGHLDDVHIYNRALSQAEAEELYSCAN